ncbi:MAG: CRISPR-associated protein Cas5 [Chloroflexota bacterium]|jgi:CRISPR-associated protein Cas5h|nr:CRISPR-associated protein Cas5 [Chloroflexota bacterium]
MRGIAVDLELPYFASFRRPTSTSVVLTYPVPPFTTLVGLLANALGVHWADYDEAMQHFRATLLVNMRPLRLERPSRELAKLLKLVGEEREVRRPASFPSSPVFRYFLVRPAFRVFVASEDGTMVDEIAAALADPARPLYLGRSDDPVVVQVVWQGEVGRVEAQDAWALVPSTEVEAGEGELLRLPLAFGNGRDLVRSPLLLLPRSFPLRLPRPQTLWQFERETVHLLRLSEEET